MAVARSKRRGARQSKSRKEEREDKSESEYETHTEGAWTAEEQYKGINKSFAKMVQDIYKRNETVDMSVLFEQYVKYREEVQKGSVDRGMDKGIDRGSIQVEADKTDKTEADRSSTKTFGTVDLQTILQARMQNQNVFQQARGTENKQESTVEKQSSTEQSERDAGMPHNSRKRRIDDDHYEHRRNRATKEPSIQGEDSTDSTQKDVDGTQEGTKGIQEGVDSAQTEQNESSNTSILLALKCKAFARKTKKFEDIGFYEISIVQDNGTTYIRLTEKKNKKSIVSTPVSKSSVQSKKETKEIAFVDATTAKLYKVKLATVQEADRIRELCTAHKTEETT